MEYSYYAHWQFPVYFFFEVTPLSLGLYSACFGLMSLCISFCNKSNERFIQWMVEKAFNFIIDNTVQVDTQRGNKRRGPRKFIETLTASGVGVLHKVVELFLRF